MINADEATCDSQTGYSNKFVQLFKGDVDVHLKRGTSVKDKFNNALITVYNDRPDLKELPVTFGYSIRFETNVCGTKAYQTNGQQMLKLQTRIYLMILPLKLSTLHMIILSHIKYSTQP